jgi:hypothetical protein
MKIIFGPFAAKSSRARQGVTYEFNDFLGVFWPIQSFSIFL